MSLEERIITIRREKIIDHRGWFLKTIDGKEKFNPFPCEVYFTVAKPGESKGGHYHNIAKEWFTLIKGEAELTLIDIETKEKIIIQLEDKNPVTVFVSEKIAHNFRNTSKTEDFILVAYTDKMFNLEDTIPYKF